MYLNDKTEYELIEIIEGDFQEKFQISALEELLRRFNKDKINKAAQKYYAQKIKEDLRKIGVTNFDDFKLPESKILTKEELKKIFIKEFEKHVERRKDFYDDIRIY